MYAQIGRRCFVGDIVSGTSPSVTKLQFLHNIRLGEVLKRSVACDLVLGFLFFRIWLLRLLSAVFLSGGLGSAALFWSKHFKWHDINGTLVLNNVVLLGTHYRYYLHSVFVENIIADKKQEIVIICHVCRNFDRDARCKLQF